MNILIISRCYELGCVQSCRLAELDCDGHAVREKWAGAELPSERTRTYKLSLNKNIC